MLFSLRWGCTITVWGRSRNTLSPVLCSVLCLSRITPPQSHRHPAIYLPPCCRASHVTPRLFHLRPAALLTTPPLRHSSRHPGDPHVTPVFPQVTPLPPGRRHPAFALLANCQHGFCCYPWSINGPCHAAELCRQEAEFRQGLEGNMPRGQNFERFTAAR